MNLFVFLSYSLLFQLTISYYVSSSIGEPFNDGLTPDHPLISIEMAISSCLNSCSIFLCEGDVFSVKNGLTISNKVIEITSYTCNSSNAGISPVITRSQNVLQKPIKTTTIGKWNILTFNLSSYVNSKSDRVVGLWINGIRQMTARYPNLIDPTILYGQDRKEFIDITGFSPSSLTPHQLKNMASNYWAGGIVRWRETDWSYASYKIDSVTSGILNLKTVNLRSEVNRTSYLEMPGFFIEHGYQELDVPGEYYFDPDTGMLHVIPINNKINDMWVMIGGDLGTELEFPTINILNAQINLDHIEITMGQVGILFGYNSRQGLNSLNSISHVSITKITNIAVEFANCSICNSLLVSDSFFQDVENGIMGIGGVNILVQRSTFNRVALAAGYQSMPAGVFCRYAKTCVILNNKFTNMGYNGIHLTGGARAEGNIISSYLMTLSDGGGIYFPGNSSHDIVVGGNNVTKPIINSISSFNRGFSGFGAGIYGDFCNNNNLIINNWIQPMNPIAYGMLFNNPYNNRIINNTLMDATIRVSNVPDGCEIFGNTLTGNYFLDSVSKDPTFMIYFDDTNGKSQQSLNTIWKDISNNIFCSKSSQTDKLWHPIGSLGRIYPNNILAVNHCPTNPNQFPDPGAVPYSSSSTSGSLIKTKFSTLSTASTQTTISTSSFSAISSSTSNSCSNGGSANSGFSTSSSTSSPPSCTSTFSTTINPSSITTSSMSSVPSLSSTSSFGTISSPISSSYSSASCFTSDSALTLQSTTSNTTVPVSSSFIEDLCSSSSAVVSISVSTSAADSSSDFSSTLTSTAISSAVLSTSLTSNSTTVRLSVATSVYTSSAYKPTPSPYVLMILVFFISWLA